MLSICQIAGKQGVQILSDADSISPDEGYANVGTLYRHSRETELNPRRVDVV